ncbi:hypothetical protein KP509_19G020200 [Ceratopteris richardii]|uniref:NAD(P)-binding domain-containing protein n=1 Tax=Ceratopteris richardii TaxID=49495 RepID=A0A8T2SLL9_CERRI|nr:hypothetical protein KP509_19G020200 [Ceratopteris richardii]
MGAWSLPQKIGKESAGSVKAASKKDSSADMKSSEEVSGTNTSSNPTERNKLLILGGSGFVGTHICKEALQQHLPVISLSRSGRPKLQESWTFDVRWVQGSLFEPDKWKHVLEETSAVISCVGGFGSNETMRKVNGDANIAAINAAYDSGVKRFLYISAFDFGLPSFVLRGYYEGKKAAEEALRIKFPYGGIILRPGFIHGDRQVGSIKVPLSLLGTPLETVLKHAKSVTQIPFIGPFFVPPVKVTTVAKAAVRAATDNAVPPGVLSVWGINRLGDS